MSDSMSTYVYRTPEGGWRLTGTRVSLDSIVQAYWDGQPPEAIAGEFPTLTFEQVYGAITFYLHHRAEIDAYLATQDSGWENVRQASQQENAALLQRLRQARAGVVGPNQPG